MTKLYLSLLVVLSLASASYAATSEFKGHLTGAAEVPPNASAGVGDAIVSYDPVTHLLGVNVSFSGLSGNTTAAHIHCCTAPGTNTGVATTVPTFAGFPLGVMSGQYNNILDLTQASSFNPSFVAANGGTVAGAEAALANGLANGMAYLNIHSSVFGSGEIRAFLVPLALGAAPTLSVVGLGVLAILLAVAGIRWVRRVER